MNKFKGLLLIGLLSFATAALADTVVNFNGVPGAGANPILTNLNDEGFTFTGNHFHIIGDTSVGTISNGTIFMGEEGGSLGQPITMALTGGGSFSMSGIDAGQLWLGGNAGFPNANFLDIDVFFTGGGSTTISLALTNGFLHYSLNLNGIDHVVFSGDGNQAIAFDNIDVSPATSNTPEPASLVLLGSGLLAGYRKMGKA